MEIVVNDTNIFIDLYELGLLDDFFKLPLIVHTADFVISEITKDEQLFAITKHIDANNLTVRKFGIEEVVSIQAFSMTVHGNLTFTDCAVWKYAMDNGYTLLTGDKRLRNQAEEANVTVRGIIYIFDLLIEHQVLTPPEGAEKLKMLFLRNPRLPKTAIEERIEKWTQD